MTPKVHFRNWTGRPNPGKVFSREQQQQQQNKNNHHCSRLLLFAGYYTLSLMQISYTCSTFATIQFYMIKPICQFRKLRLTPMSHFSWVIQLASGEARIQNRWVWVCPISSPHCCPPHTCLMVLCRETLLEIFWRNDVAKKIVIQWPERDMEKCV